MRTPPHGRRVLVYCNAPGTPQRGPSGQLVPVIRQSPGRRPQWVCGRCGQRVRIAW